MGMYLEIEDSRMLCKLTSVRNVNPYLIRELKESVVYKVGLALSVTENVLQGEEFLLEMEDSDLVLPRLKVIMNINSEIIYLRVSNKVHSALKTYNMFTNGFYDYLHKLFVHLSELKILFNSGSNKRGDRITLYENDLMLGDVTCPELLDSVDLKVVIDKFYNIPINLLINSNIRNTPISHNTVYQIYSKDGKPFRMSIYNYYMNHKILRETLSRSSYGSVIYESLNHLYDRSSLNITYVE